MYDVVVIGAGPGGSTSARYLAKYGLNVCLIDKAEFPRDKPCGGAIPNKLLDNFKYLKSRSREFLKSISSGGFLHSPDRKTVLKGSIPLAMVLRTEFDNILLNLAKDEGVNTILGLMVKSLEFRDDQVIIHTNRNDSLSSRVVIGADGVNSVVARTTGLNKRWLPGSLVVCRVAEIPMSVSDITQYYGDDHEYHFFSGSWDQVGYGWVFPKYETVNVGLGVIDKAAQGLPRRFQGFVKLLQQKGLLKKNANLSSTKGALVPITGPINSTVHDRCLLIGDAAGMVNPLTGGGIDYAMQTGKIAAKILIHAFDVEQFDSSILMAYQNAWKRQLGQEFRNQLLAQKILISPFSNALFKIGSRDTVIQNMVVSAMSESLGESLNVSKLIARTMYVCLREAVYPFSSRHGY